MDITHWIISLIGFAIGLLFWVITYIGAPRASKKSGKFVSGVPGTPFICFILSGLLSPCKWLALLCFLDFEITILPFYLLKDLLSKKKAQNNKNDTDKGI